MLLLPLCLVSQYSNAQTSTTGQLFQDNQWSGCYTYASGGFWGGTSGGPCPAMSFDEGYAGSNQIIFSYGRETLSQTYSLANALPNSGTGLQVNGYNWHWHVKNSNINGTQPGSYDQVAYVNVSLLSSTGSVLESDTYDYGYHLPDWINPSGTRTYTNPYSTTQASSIRLSVTGQDGGNWAGYYGPEFMHFSLTVNYSVDPCADNPFYSPTCPGFAEALAKLSETANTGTEEQTAATDSASTGMDTDSNTQTAAADPIRSVTEVTTDVGGAELSATGEIVIDDGVPSAAKESAKESMVKEEQQAQESAVASTERKPGAKVNALSIAQNAARQAEQTALSVAAQSTEQSLSAMSNPADGVGLDSLGTGIRIPGLTFLQNLAMTTTESMPSQSYSLTRTQSMRNQDQAIISTNLSQSETKTTAAVDTTVTQSQVAQPQEQTQTTAKSAVRNGGKVEGMEGGADMTALTKPPANFNQYLQAQLVDAAFYQQREIYRGQRTVDNVRALRGLGTDRLHQQMVDQQYGR